MAKPLAAIDIGTNTVRLLIAQPTGPTGLVRLADVSVTVRLGLGVDADGRLAPERIDRAAAVVAELADRARAAGATTVLALATSAVRDAANRDDFLALARARSGLLIEVIDGAREAQLTFRGALLGRPIAGRQLVADVGGGSTELILARDGAILTACSLQLGSGRLTERCLPGDPPSPAEVQAGRALAGALLAGAPDGAVDEAILVGGTASALLRLTSRAADDDRLTRAQLAAVLARVLAAPAAAVAAASGVDPERARVLPGGIIIVEAVMDRFGLDALSISQGGIREGAVLEYLAAGGAEGE